MFPHISIRQFGFQTLFPLPPVWLGLWFMACMPPVLSPTFSPLFPSFFTKSVPNFIFLNALNSKLSFPPSPSSHCNCSYLLQTGGREDMHHKSSSSCSCAVPGETQTLGIVWIMTMSFTGTQDKCKACDKTVHFIDLLTADGVPYRKSCFKCSHCKGTVSVNLGSQPARNHAVPYKLLQF